MEPNHADGYRFGIELEYRLKLKRDPKKYSDRQKVREQLAKLWNEAGKAVDGHIPMKSSYDMMKAEDFKVWTIVDECAMEGSEDEFTFSLEFVSPIFSYKDCLTWRNQIKMLSDHISRHTIPEMDETTGIHIHVAPANGRWTLLDLKRIADAVVYFDKPLKTMFPEHKYTTSFLKSSLRHNPKLNNLPKGQTASPLIHDAKTIDELILLMNPPEGRNMFTKRDYAWNFTNNSNDKEVCAKPKHTIEFRSPRSTTACNLIEQWIIFTVTFLHGSVTSPENIHYEFEATVDGLNGFLYHNRPPGGTDDYCWEKHLAPAEQEKVRQDAGHYTVEN